MAFEENKRSNISLKKNLYKIPSYIHKFKISKLNLKPIIANGSIYSNLSKEISSKRIKQFPIKSFEIYKKNNFNKNNIKNKLISKLFNSFSDRNFENNQLNQKDFLNTRLDNKHFNLNIISYNNFDYNNIPIIKYKKNNLEKTITSKDSQIKKCEYKTIFLKKNLSANYYKTSFDLNDKKEDKDIIISKNNKLFNNDDKTVLNKRKVDSISQTKVTVFDSIEEKENKKDLYNEIKKTISILPYLYINKKKVKHLLNKNNDYIISKNKNNKNSFILKNNRTINKKSLLSLDLSKSRNKYKIKNSFKINGKTNKKSQKPVCIVNNCYLCF